MGESLWFAKRGCLTRTAQEIFDRSHKFLATEVEAIDLRSLDQRFEDNVLRVRPAMIAAICALLILVLTIAAPLDSEAECAWVLWVTAAPADSSGAIVGAWTPWVPHGATDSPGGCDALGPKDPQASKRVYEATGIRLATGQVASLAWQCLPDTVDARGPKGGGR